ncbi:MAG TPA: energy transducer TonB [Thermoanaerobaculia bacterium]|jgi:protein TonB|nr:energy transducer TonB [Thermoanaerobaculia bacterium]
MFETSVVRARVAQRRFSLLSVSLAAHSLVIIAVLAASIASISFPKAPPHESTVFYQQAPPPPPPAAPRQPVQQPPVQAHPATTVPSVVPHAAVTPMPLTPLTIPNSMPTVSSTSNDIGPAIGNPATSGTGSSDVGDPNGVDIGQPAANTTPTADTVFHPGADVRPASVIFRVEPQYPQVALRTRMAGTVVVKCIVDKSGNVRDAEVVTSSFAAFNEPALNALQQWRFAPGSFHGKPVDTWFELTIRFQPR